MTNSFVQAQKTRKPPGSRQNGVLLLPYKKQSLSSSSMRPGRRLRNKNMLSNNNKNKTGFVVKSKSNKRRMLSNNNNNKTGFVKWKTKPKRIVKQQKRGFVKYKKNNNVLLQ
jgi:hypothetical protein